jgi:hypothetical protein
VAADWGVYVRGWDRRLLASLDGWTDLSVALRYNDVSSWQITAPVSAASRYLATAGNGVVIRRGQQTLLSGPVTSYTEKWAGDDPGAGTLVITGKDDLVALQQALAEPDPLVSGTPTQANDRISGSAETVIRRYVDRNIGMSALAGRVRHRMGQTTDSGAGSATTGNARYDNLLDLVRSLATAGGVGFRAVQDAGGVAPLFDVFVPVDRSGTVVFSKTGGSLAAYSYTLSAPTATRVTVAGQGVGVDRTVIKVSSTDGVEDVWDMTAEVFADRRDTDEADDHLQEADERLIDGGATAGLSITPIDLPSMSFGDDYYLGDRVSVDIDETTRITDVLAAVTISTSIDGGEQVSPVIGAGDTSESPALFSVLRKLGTRVGLLEKRL